MQTSFTMRMSSIENVKRFVSAATNSVCSVDVSTGKYTVDGKSILGMFSIDLSREVTVTVNGSDENEVNTLVEALQKISE